jgi:hypothetical protein
MGITIIDNQPVKFNKQQSCVCWEKSYCQLVNNNDDTQFEIKSSQVVPNADFESGFDDWNLIDEIIVSAYTVNTTEGVCEGEIDATATGGNGGPYEYSIDGINFQSSGLFEDLCEGEYTVTARDTDGNEGSTTFEIFVNANCEDYECSTLQDLIDSDLPLGAFLNCQLLDFLCSEEGVAKTTGEVYFAGSLGPELTADPDFTTGGGWFQGGPSPYSTTDGYVIVDSLAGDLIQTNTIASPGSVYLIEIVVDSVMTGTAQLLSGEAIGELNGAGTFLFVYKKAASLQRIILLAATASQFRISKFSVKQITGAPDAFFEYNIGDVVPITLNDNSYVELTMIEKGADGIGPYFKFASFDSDQNVKVYY